MAQDVAVVEEAGFGSLFFYSAVAVVALAGLAALAVDAEIIQTVIVHGLSSLYCFFAAVAAVALAAFVVETTTTVECARHNVKKV